MIKVTDDSPFKEQFRQIPLPLVEEVCAHLWEMLDSGMICPSQSAWCNAIVLFQKKDGSMHFCIDFCCLNAHIAKNLTGTWKSGRCRPFFLPGPEIQILADQDGQAVEAKTHIYHWQPGFLCVWLHALWAVQHVTFQRLMQNYLRELNLTYCLIYLDDIIIFSQMTEEHLHCLCIIFDWFREHNLKLKPSKHDFFRNEFTYLAHQISKDGVCSSDSNLKAITECAMLQTYTEVHAFLSLVGHYRRFIKRFTCITQPLSEYLTGEGASRKLEWVSLTKEGMKAFEALKQACMTGPILVFTDYTKLFLLETDASKDGLGMVLSQKQADGWYHPVAYCSRSLMPCKKNYHSTKLEFLALKRAVTEYFKEYLPYQSFVVWMDNNPLMYIMSTPNLDAIGHWWVGALTQFNFELEYHKGCVNTVVDVLSQVSTRLDLETVKSIPKWVTLGMAHQAKLHDLAMVEGDQQLEQEVWVTAGCPLVEMHVTSWAEVQREDPTLSTVLDWLKAQKQTNLKMLLAEHTSSEEAKLILWNQ